MDNQPLDIPLPIGNIDRLVKAARRLRRDIFGVDNAPVQLDIFKNCLSACLGYESFADACRWKKIAMWPGLDAPYGILLYRQHLRETNTLATFLRHLDAATLEAKIQQLQLVDWSTVRRVAKEEKWKRTLRDSPNTFGVVDCQWIDIGGESRPQFVVASDVFTPVRPNPFREVPLPKPVDITQWETSEAPEVFIPPTIKFAAEKARALTFLNPSISSDTAHAITARIFGFDNWSALEERYESVQARLEKVSLFDEEVDRQHGRIRHQWQVETIQRCMAISRFDAVGLRLDWRPTARAFQYSMPSTRVPAAPPPRFAGRITLTGVSSPNVGDLQAQALRAIETRIRIGNRRESPGGPIVRLLG